MLLAILGIRRTYINKHLLNICYVLLIMIIIGGVDAEAQTVNNESNITYVPGTQPAVKLPRLTSPIQFDGKIDDDAWAQLTPLPLVMYAPTYKGDITAPTTVWVAYDEAYIYLAGRLAYEKAGQMRANSISRDQWSGDDTFAIVIDPFNDNENARWFYTTPYGVRSDIAVSDDAALGRASSNASWNTFWDTKSQIIDGVWETETRIPFSSLGYQKSQNEDGEITMGIIVYRWLAHNNHRYIYPDIPPNWERGSNKPSVAQDVTLKGVKGKRPIYITPYLLGGVRQVATLNETETAFGLPRDWSREVGLDVKYNVTSNLTLDVSANTDFAQVEIDDQQINLTRFSLFFPEKRQFFQERSGLFDFSSGISGSRLFHSRRIGLADGAPIRILGGARLSGRVGDWDIGVLNMQTAAERGLPSENTGVARLRKKVLNANSNVGGIFTSRIAEDGDYNVTYGFDTVLRLKGEEYLTAKWMQTYQSDEASSLSALERARFMLNWERRSINGLSYSVELTRSGEAYDPGLGFIRRRDVTYLSPDINYQSFRGEDSKFRRIWVGNWSNVYFRNSDGSVESAWLHPFYWFELKNGATVLLSTDHTYEDVPADFSLSDEAIVPADSYWFHDIWLQAAPPDKWFFRPSFYGIYGSFYDGWRATTGINSTWNISPHLELRLNYEINLIRFPDRDQELTTHLPQVRIQSALNTHFSAAAYVQYNSLAKNFSVNTRFRYHFREGHDLWLVYNEGMNTLRDRNMQPLLPRTASRAVLLKYTYTLLP